MSQKNYAGLILSALPHCNLAECLLAQADLLPCDSGLIKQILLNCMKELERKKYQVIAQGLKDAAQGGS